jgi:hypothetical protein
MYNYFRINVFTDASRILCEVSKLKGGNMADDKWGYKSLSLIITEQGEKDKYIDLISYHYVENDSYQYINRGSERRICIEFSKYVTVDLLKFVLEKLNPSNGLKNILQKMIKENKIESGEYWDKSDT